MQFDAFLQISRYMTAKEKLSVLRLSYVPKVGNGINQVRARGALEPCICLPPDQRRLPPDQSPWQQDRSPFHTSDNGCSLKIVSIIRVGRRIAGSPQIIAGQATFLIEPILRASTMNQQAIEWLLSKINIHVSGACGPRREQPIECYYAMHQAYHQHCTPSSSQSSSRPRCVPSSSTRGGTAIVFDKDIVSTWRLPNTMAAYEVFYFEKAFECALGQGTMLVAIEAFLDQESASSVSGSADITSQRGMLCRFQHFLRQLEAQQPVTLTVSSLVHDMIDSRRAELQLPPPIWKESMDACIRAFLCTRECFFQRTDQAPYVEVTFSGKKLRLLLKTGSRDHVELTAPAS